MEQLIWFSIPGAILGVPIALIYPQIFSSTAYSIVAVALFPVIGFILHQFFRLCFEKTGGFARKSRTSLDHILKELELQESIRDSRPDIRFLVWEITFYGKEFPPAFFEHDRRCWHYILSFWSVALAAFLAVAIAMCGFLFQRMDNHLLMVALAELLLGVVFCLKGYSTYHGLIKQEIAVFHKYKDLFRQTVDSIKEMPKTTVVWSARRPPYVQLFY
jgi:hypothetical protein